MANSSLVWETPGPPPRLFLSVPQFHPKQPIEAACLVNKTPVIDVFQNDIIDGDLFLIRILPDEDGKFGFNLKVKGTDKAILTFNRSFKKYCLGWNNSGIVLDV